MIPQKRIYLLLSVVISLLLAFSGVKGFSQGTDIKSGKKQQFYLGVNICPASTSIINNGSYTISRLISQKNNSIFFTVEAGYQLTKYFGLSTGIGYGTYLSNLSLAAYDNHYDTIDSDTPSETYTRYVTGTDIKELQKISFIDIPLIADIQIPFNDVFGIYLQTGVNFSVPVNKTYSSSGIFTYEGYYQVYDIHISDVPYEGFEVNYSSSDKGGLMIKSFSTELIASGGASFTIRNQLHFSLGVFYTRMLSDISEYTSSSSYRLSSLPDQMRSMMEGSTNVSLSAIGFKLGFRYYFK